MQETNSIGRPRSFDVDETLDRVIKLFWRLGFDGTSYSDLEVATGLHRQSLRYAFGDKAELFSRALDRYAHRKTTEILSALEGGDTPLAGVSKAFHIWARDAGTNGCLLVNALAEKGSSDLAALATARRATQILHDGFKKAFQKAQSRGEIRSDVAPDLLAAQAVAIGDGLMVQSRGQASPVSPLGLFMAYLDLLRP